LSRRDQIIGLLGDAGGALDDDEVARRLGINRHYVNTICRKLAADHKISRTPGPSGKVVNALVGEPNRATVPDPVPVGTAPQSQTRARMRRQDRARQNVDALIGSFADCVSHFESSNAFPGPSLYFHERAIQRRREHATVRELLADDRFLEYVYAVLPAWGMHRMGKQAAKVGDFDVMVSSIRAVGPAIEELWALRITDIRVSDETFIADQIWQIISSVRVSTSATRIVAGSKTLHHFLPDLVPPIDRQYTFQFFTGQKMVTTGEEQAFTEWFPYFSEIGRRCRANIDATLARAGFMATGAAKVIDNAIIGFMQRSGAPIDLE
jgi:hypothetical protein